MDINELNKMSVTALFSKLTAQPNAASGAGNSFASLLGQANAEDLLPNVSKNVQTVKNKPVESSDTKIRQETPADKNKDAAPADRNDNKKIAAKKPAKADNGKGVVENKAAPTVEEDVSEGDSKARTTDGADVLTMMIPVAEPLTPIAEANGVNLSEAVTTVGDAMADGIAFEGAGTVGVEAGALPADSITVLDADGKSIEGFALTPADLIEQPLIRVIDAATGQVSEMSGAQLAAQLFGVEETNKALVAAGHPVMEVAGVGGENKTPEMSKILPEMPVVENKDFANQIKEVVKTAVAENVEQAPIEKSGTADLVSAAAIKAAGHQSKAETTPLVNDKNDLAAIDDDAELQAAKLDEMLNGRQLKVDVKVSEEKIAYRSGQDLVKDRLALDKAVAAAADESGVSNPLIPSAVNSSATAAQTAMPLTMPAQTVAPIAAQALVAAADDTAPQAAGMTEISGISPSTAGQAAGASVSEFVNAAKAEANSKANDVSFRDVYKGMSKEVVDQVKVNITKSAVKGVDTIDVHLKPEDLGRIEVKMQIKDGKLQAHIISSRPETMEALQKEAQTLERAFNDAGFQTDENSLTFSYQNNGEQANQRQENELRNFIGEVFETEANSELLSAEAANQNWTAEKGLNIKV